MRCSACQDTGMVKTVTYSVVGRRNVLTLPCGDCGVYREMIDDALKARRMSGGIKDTET